jgi:hypothetical protein
MEELLIKLNAPHDFIAFSKDKTWEEIYHTCHRGDWLAWLFARVNPNEIKLISLIKGVSAELVHHDMKDKRSLKAFQMAIDYYYGDVNLKQLKQANNLAKDYFESLDFKDASKTTRFKYGFTEYDPHIYDSDYFASLCAYEASFVSNNAFLSAQSAYNAFTYSYVSYARDIACRVNTVSEQFGTTSLGNICYDLCYDATIKQCRGGYASIIIERIPIEKFNIAHD